MQSWLQGAALNCCAATQWRVASRCVSSHAGNWLAVSVTMAVAAALLSISEASAVSAGRAWVTSTDSLSVAQVVGVVPAPPRLVCR